MPDATTVVDALSRDLAQAIETAAPSAHLTTAVLDGSRPNPCPNDPGPDQRRRLGDWLRARLRWVVGLLVTLILIGVGVSPVGAAVRRVVRLPWRLGHPDRGGIPEREPGRPASRGTSTWTRLRHWSGSRRPCLRGSGRPTPSASPPTVGWCR